MIDESFGVIPLQKRETGWQLFIVFHKSGKYWGFPKGHANPEESHLDSALRELKEETNLDFERSILETPFVEKYEYVYQGKKIFKTVLYYLIEVKGTIKLQKEEIIDGRWCSFLEAEKLLTFNQSKEFCKEVQKILK
ncbi:MAG: NUDIX domain-containing protein [Chlamydiae bacterium]|nr:NUDIX domain-containing protein [Chlamydiota bacterium]